MQVEVFRREGEGGSARERDWYCIRRKQDLSASCNEILSAGLEIESCGIAHVWRYQYETVESDYDDKHDIGKSFLALPLLFFLSFVISINESRAIFIASLKS